MLTKFERLMEIRTGGSVERCHGIVHQGSYSNAMHSWGVSMLMLLLWPQDFARLAVYCLTHDVPEAWVGDIPAPTKRYCGSLKIEVGVMESRLLRRLELPDPEDLSLEDKRKLKACDILELYIWAKEQLCAGNWHADCIRRELERFVEEEPLLEPAQKLYEELYLRPAKEFQHATDGHIHALMGGLRASA